jgi:hypothetical protein
MASNQKSGKSIIHKIWGRDKQGRFISKKSVIEDVMRRAGEFYDAGCEEMLRLYGL